MNEYSYREHHMGTVVSLSFVCTDEMTADKMAHYAFAVINEYERCFSRFLTESELSHLNQHGYGTVSTTFMHVLKRSIELATLTHGHFNPLLQVKALGYDTTYQKLTVHTEISPLHPTTYNKDLHACYVDSSSNFIALGPNQQLDFGGILKGYLSELLADTLMHDFPDCAGLIVNLGGDLTTRGTDTLHNPFIFLLYNPITGEEFPVPLTNTSLATSGTYARQWQSVAGPQHHIVDPITHMNPDTSVTSVSIITPDGGLAEALTKLFLTTDLTSALTTLPPSVYQYQYFIVYTDGSITTSII
jgi:FAD:protein FMN transferase